MTEDLAKKIRNCPTLPSMPAIAMQVLNLAQQPNVNIQEIAQIISKDPALSGKILRTVNSSFYARSKPVSTISQALVILGLQSVKTLVLGFSLVSNLSAAKSSGFDHQTYWKRSIYAATAARTIAVKIALPEQEEAFLGALLKDIGMLVLDMVAGKPYGEVCAKAATHGDLPALERDALGTTHAEVGAMLAELWKLPRILSLPIAYSHHADATPDAAIKRLSQVVEFAGFCGDVFVDDGPSAAIKRVRESALAHFAIKEADCDTLLSDINARTHEVASLFEINIGAHVDYEAVLKKANEALVDLTLQTQMQATQLQAQNEQLQERATTDGLTGLSNRAAFDAYLAENFAAIAKGKSIALLLMDLDKFKRINDTHGHPAGDLVLKTVAQSVKHCAGKTGLGARYGGEEMAIVLVGADRAAAVATAECLRKTIAAAPVRAGRVAIAVTISIGVAIAEKGGPLTTPAHLIKAADLAVYAAKKAGRNCVRAITLNKRAA